MDLLNAALAIQTTPTIVEVDQLATMEEPSSDKSLLRERESKLEHKMIHEMYVLSKRTSFKKANVTSLQLG
jgi:hypothetical protein